MTRQEAERQLQQWGLEPEWRWDEDESEIPPPPLDRIALAREVLTTIEFPLNDRQASVAGCEWRLLSGDSDPLIECAWFGYGAPRSRKDLHSLIECIYLARWERAWQYGASKGATDHVFEAIRKMARLVIRQPDLHIRDTEWISKRLTPAQAEELGKSLDWVGYEGRSLLVKRSSRNPELVGVALAISLFASLILLGLWCLQKLPLWWMLVALLLFAFAYNRFEKSQRTWRWIEPELTFGELGERLHQHAMEDYMELVAFAQSMSADDR